MSINILNAKPLQRFEHLFHGSLFVQIVSGHDFVDMRHDNECNEANKELALHSMIAVYPKPPKIKAVLHLQKIFFDNIFRAVKFKCFMRVVDMVADQNHPPGMQEFFVHSIMLAIDRIARSVFSVLSDYEIFFEVFGEIGVQWVFECCEF